MNKLSSTLFSLTALAIAVSASASTQSPPAASDTALFRNGDLLYGRLLSINPSTSIEWQHPDSDQPIRFKPDSVSQIDFPETTNAGAPSTNACRITLANGDCLEGDLISCDQKSVALQTWYAGLLTIPRASLQSMVFIRPASAIFDGITGLDGWTRASSPVPAMGDGGQWTYRNGAFYADKTASIARDFKLPDDSQIQFDLAWKGTLNLAVALYTDSLRPILLTAKDQAPDFGGFYSFRFQSTVLIDLWAIKKQVPVRPLGQVMDTALNGKDRIHVDLRVSKAQHEIALFLDNALVKEWDDPEGFIGEGSGLRFVQNPGCVIKLSNLRITHWDGMFDDDGADSTDAVWLESGRKITGAVQSIAGGKVAVTSTNGPVTLAASDVKAIVFTHGQAPSTEAAAATVRATFAQGGDLTFSLDTWRPDEMSVNSPDFGHAVIKPAAFTRLLFLSPEKKSPGGPKG